MHARLLRESPGSGVGDCLGSPLKVLERGYAIATDSSGALLRDSAQVAIGDSVSIQLRRGRLTTEVKKKDA